MKYLFFLCTIILFSNNIHSQDKYFSSEDIVINSKTTLAPSTLNFLKWVPTEQSYSFVENTDNNYALVKGYIISGKKEMIVSLTSLNDLLNEFNVEVLSEFPEHEWIDSYSFRFEAEGATYVYDYDGNDLDKQFAFPEDAEDLTYSASNQYIAYVHNNNLYIAEDTDSPYQVTTDGSYDITNGKSVSRNEFGIEGGIFWSPNNNYIAFYREDLSEITDYPIFDLTTKPAKIKSIKYPMAGQNSSSVSIGIFNLETRGITWLKAAGSRDQYLTSVTWGPNEEFIYVAHLKRDQNHLILNKYEVKTGNTVATLFEEKNDKYVEPEHGLTFLPNDSDKFIWQSERDGWNHIYLYNTKGKLLKQLTMGEWVVTEVNGFDSKGENVYITTTHVSPLERHLYKVNLQKNDNKKMTVNKGTHELIVHPKFNYILDNYSGINSPGQISIINYKGNTLSIINRSNDPYKNYNTGDVRIFSIKGKNKIDLYCRLVLPPDFDSTKIYPAIVYVYGGPHKQNILDEYPNGKYALWSYRMAQEGYIVFTLDNRGSADRGLEFEQAIFRDLGTNELEDQMRGVKYLKSLKYVDADRLGVYGWSYGGFMTTTMMTRTDGVFKVGVAGGAVIDWSLYEVMYAERYMDTPQTNPEGYYNSNLLNYVENLNGKLLLVHGTDDPVVVWQHTLLYAERAMQLGKSLDYFPYVGYEHHIKDRDAIHLYDKIINYFLDNL